MSRRLMACIPRREGIVGRRHGVGIAGLPVAPLKNRLAATRSPQILFRRPFGGLLSAMVRGGAFSGLCDYPLLGTRRDAVTCVAFWHDQPSSNATFRSLSAGRHSRTGFLNFTMHVCLATN